MKLTKYQKAYLCEYLWHVHNDDHIAEDKIIGDGENTCWLQIDKEDGRVFGDAKRLLGYTRTDIENVKVLIVASKGSTTSVPKNV
jgi:hypothetical protein